MKWLESQKYQQFVDNMWKCKFNGPSLIPPNCSNQRFLIFEKSLFILAKVSCRQKYTETRIVGKLRSTYLLTKNKFHRSKSIFAWLE